MEKHNPFIHAEWNETYNLAGAVWSTKLLPPKRQPDTGVIVIGKHHPRLITVSKVWGKFNDEDWENQLLPLLPSAAWVNAQADPRASGIASLERAGFARHGNDHDTVSICFPEFDGDDFNTIRIDPESDELVYFNLCTSDPAIARYAVECFEVLHAWAAAINWGVLDE